MDWQRATAAELGRGIDRGEIDPVELTRSYLDAIEAHDARDRIYARLTADRALSEAAAAAERAKAGLRRSSLDGVPISWKDLFDTAGTATEAGTALMKGRVPSRDAEVLRNATAAGLVCLGKTHLSEIAFSGLGVNPMTATPPNANMEAAAPGGSSSGAAASIAFGLAAAGIGSDTGGSVRIPAAWNDLVGLKTTHGLLGLEGVVPLCESFDTVGPLARSVEDAGLLFAALGGTRAPDLRGATLAGKRFLVVETVQMEGLEDRPARAFEDAAQSLEAAGATIERRAWAPLQEAYDLSGPLYAADAYSWWSERVEADPDAMYHQIRDRVRAGGEVGALDYLAKWRRLRELRAEFAAFAAGYDAVLAPTAAMMPPQVERVLSDGDYYREANLLTLRNTRMANLLGLCSLTLPTGTPSAGLMLSAAPRSEARLLRLGAAAEATLAR